MAWFKKHQSLFWLSGILLVTALVFTPLSHAGFVWDDSTFILHWPVIQVATPQHLVDIFKGAQPQGQTGGYRPIRNVIMMVDYQLFGPNPVPYHLAQAGIRRMAAVR